MRQPTTTPHACPAARARALGFGLALAAAAAGLAWTPARAAEPPASRGQTLYDAKCSACHSPEAHRVGPLHRGVVGRRAGSAAGYDYSPALAASRLAWTRETLDRWLADPEALVPGQKMGFRVGSEADRRALVSYLETLKP